MFLIVTNAFENTFSAKIFVQFAAPCGFLASLVYLMAHLMSICSIASGLNGLVFRSQLT